MCHPDFTRGFTLYTDASRAAVGAILAQDVDGLERVVAYACTTLTRSASESLPVVLVNIRQGIMADCVVCS